MSLINKTIDNYKILARIGKGGMGVVYKALDLTLEKEVALKMVDPLLANDERFLKRFRNEARTLAKLDNPNIITVHAFRETEEGVFMIMRYVEGQTLAQLIDAHGPISFHKAVPIVKQILHGLSHAHAAGVIHRDIKPNNIMITHEGVVKVMDFGLARMQHGPDSTLTFRGVGTIRYMSPEQVERPDNLDHRTDIYSLGMTFYEMLAGETPFGDTTTDFAIMKAIVEDTFPVPGAINPKVPKLLNKIVMKALEKRPEDRFQKAEEMLKEIHRFEKYDKLNVISRTTVKIREHRTRRAHTTHTATTGAKTRSTHHKRGIRRKLKELRLPIAASLAAVTLLVALFAIFKNPASKTRLSVTSRPAGAAVTINNERVGTTPLDRLPLEAGMVAVHFTKAGYVPFDTLLTIEAGEALTLNPGLQRFASVAIEVDPADARVAIADTPIDPGQFSNLEMRPGEYTVEVSLEGFDSIRETVVLEAGERHALAYTLEPIALLVLDVTPPEAEVTVDGAILDPSQLTGLKLEPGFHTIKVASPGYETIEEKILLSQGSRDTLQYHLATTAVRKVDKVIATGTLHVTTEPAAVSVWLDGRKMASATPLTLNLLRAGRHKIELRKPGYKTSSASVNVLENRDNYFYLKLEALPKVQVSITAKDSKGKYLVGKIYVNGRYTGFTTPQQFDFPIGVYSIEVKKGGYISAKKPVTLRSDSRLEFVLRPLTN
ncbi:MAG: PEGA domain-containing protein [bacterium]